MRLWTILILIILLESVEAGGHPIPLASLSSLQPRTHRISRLVENPKEHILYIPGMRDPIASYEREFAYQNLVGSSVYYLVPRSQLPTYRGGPDFLPDDIHRGVARTLKQAHGRPVTVVAHSLSTSVVEEYLRLYPDEASKVYLFVFTSPLLQNLLELRSAWSALSSKDEENVLFKFPVVRHGRVSFIEVRMPVGFYRYYIRMFHKVLDRPLNEQPDVARLVFTSSLDPVFIDRPNIALDFYGSMEQSGMRTRIVEVPVQAEFHNLLRDPLAQVAIHAEWGQRRENLADFISGRPARTTPCGGQLKLVTIKSF